MALASPLVLALAACASRPAAAPDFLLLGEVHDNPQQHAWRAQRLAALLADGRPTAVVFEQLPAARNAALEARQRGPASVDELVTPASSTARPGPGRCTGRCSRLPWRAMRACSAATWRETTCAA